MKIGIQGEAGAFSHEAVLAMLGGVEVVPHRTFEDLFAALGEGQVRTAVVPVENSIAGPVAVMAELLAKSGLAVKREYRLPVVQCLISAQDTSLEDIRQAYSLPIAFAQCQRFFAQHPEIVPVPFYDTAGAVQYVVAHATTHAAAIAGELAAQIHGGKVLMKGIQDRDDNVTRFVLLGDEK